MDAKRLAVDEVSAKPDSLLPPPEGVRSSSEDLQKENLPESVLNLISSFRADCNLRGMKVGRNYAMYSAEFCGLLAYHGKDPQQAEKEDLKQFLQALRARGMKRLSIEGAFCGLSSFYDYLISEDLADFNPIPAFRKRYVAAQYKGDECEVRKVISVAEASRMTAGILNSRDRAVVLLLFKTGIRNHELSELDLSDLDIDSLSLTLKRTAKRSNRQVFFDYEAQKVLKVWLKARESKKPGPALFPSRKSGRMDTTSIKRVVEKYAALAALHDPTSKRLQDRFSPHCCRHCFTTWLMESGMSAEYVAWLRGDKLHRSLDRYYHIDPKKVLESYLEHVPKLGI